MEHPLVLGVVYFYLWVLTGMHLADAKEVIQYSSLSLVELITLIILLDFEGELLQRLQVGLVRVGETEVFKGYERF
jgi:hypothetical protein